MIVSIIAFLIIFGVIVISHEFGHYMIATRNGIRCTEFDIGMGPTLWHKKKGDTDFCLKAFPLGGACIFDGMNGLEQEKGDFDEHAFPNAPVGARIATVFAGPCANFIVGLIFAMIIVAFCGTDLPVVQTVMDGSAAQEAGLQTGDTITKINGESIHVYREVSLASVFNYGTEMSITYLRDGKKYTVALTPKFSKEDNRYYIGLQGGGQVIKCNALQVFQYGFYEAEYWFRMTYKSIGLMFTGHFSKDDISGPVGVVKVVDDTYNSAKPYGLPAVLLSFLNLATLLSINLGVVNLLPLPALDGGRLVFLIIEAIRGKPVPPEKEGMVHLAGIIALMVLMVFVMMNDLSRFFR
jgi:regulator of sigma E protease